MWAAQQNVVRIYANYGPNKSDLFFPSSFLQAVCRTLDEACRVGDSATYSVDVQTMVQTNLSSYFPRNVRSVSWQVQRCMFIQ